MNTAFEQYLGSQTQLTESEIGSISALAKVRRLRRNESLLTAGEICRSKIFVQNGLLRIYTLSAEGSETIFYFLQEQAWTSLDVESYDKQTPSLFNVTAIESAGILVWNKPDFDRLLSEMPELKKCADRVGAQKVQMNKHRLMTALIASPEEKYDQFKRDYPELIQRVPLHMIAAYLGISVKTLTRIRHAQWMK